MPRAPWKPPLRICGAKTRSGAPCRKAAVRGRTRCRLHGGGSNEPGPGHHSWKHGRNSRTQRYPRLLAEMPEADPAEVRDTTDDLQLHDKRAALLDAEIADAAAVSWRELRTMADGIDAAGDPKLEALLDAIRRTGTADAQWRELLHLSQDRIRAAQTDKSVQLRAIQVLTPSDYDQLYEQLELAFADHKVELAAQERIISAIADFAGRREKVREQISGAARPIRLTIDSPARDT